MIRFFIIITIISSFYFLFKKYYKDPMSELKRDRIILQNEEREYNKTAKKAESFEQNITTKKEDAKRKIDEIPEVYSDTNFSDGDHVIHL